MFSIEWVIVIVCAYFLGAIPFGYIVGRMKGIDIRRHGSGNVGFTNVWRTLGISSGVVVLICDAAKGYLASAIGYYLLGTYGTLIGGVVAILGHTFSCFIQFKGGKGVATGGGFMLFMSPLTLIICVGTLIVIVALTRYMSLGSIIAVGMAPIVLYLTGGPIEYVLGVTMAALYVIYLHIPNIRRLLNGTENKVGHTKEKKGETHE